MIGVIGVIGGRALEMDGRFDCFIFFCVYGKAPEEIEVSVRGLKRGDKVCYFLAGSFT